ncbi:MAG TPA: polyprenyl synthetase family protein [Phycisphaerae bacterium]|nr:polyprenyl synthetase family protein [Phycisphaerae bacterium]HRY67706.1 polyprenyl synthetase family protein [Phycisphaerae bacterium]HSA25157.1 polyprenyl synthetase family protein [Phycisphaerae bacterium]
MPASSSLYEPIATDLEKVCAVFDDELFSDLPIVNELCAHLRHYRGKMLRPGLLLLSARACGKVTDEHLALAAIVELIHMATLVHDDVLDEADVRRRGPTIHRLEGNEAAVLLGDYLFSHAFHLCSSLDSQYASRILGATTNTVCEGELHQVHHRGDLNLSQEQYLEIITRKTASLIGTCCRVGAHFAGADERVAATLEQYGLSFGIAFQITDDVLDITGNEDRMGKSLGRDLQKRKLTLPLIHSLAKSPPETQRRLRKLLTTEEPDRSTVCQILGETDSVSFALATARKYVETATTALEVLPPSDARDALRRMATLVSEREQ